MILESLSSIDEFRQNIIVLMNYGPPLASASAKVVDRIDVMIENFQKIDSACQRTAILTSLT